MLVLKSPLVNYSVNARRKTNKRNPSVRKSTPSERVACTISIRATDDVDNVVGYHTSLHKRVMDAIDRASVVCSEAPDSKACLMALDVMDELTKAYYDLEARYPGIHDPLERYCMANPSEDECRIYDV